MSGLNAISVSAKTFSQNGQVDFVMYNGNSLSGYGYNAPIGHGHLGPTELQRVTMALRSGIDSEVSWALTTLTRISAHTNLVLPSHTFLGGEMIKYFTRPYQLIVEQKEDKVTSEMVSLSLDCLLSLRNCAQDLSNQQWLSQVKGLRKSLVEVLRFLSNWFFQGQQSAALKKYDNQFYEGLRYLVDLLEPLTCYWVNNSKSDPLFNILLADSQVVTDKSLFIGILKCLSHLLINKAKEERSSVLNPADDDGRSRAVNCIDVIKDTQLENFVNYLLVDDNELSFTVLEFLKMYLSSEAIHPKCSNVADSQLLRLNYLLELKGSKSSFNTLVKQLPLLVVSNLPLNEVSTKPLPQTLTKRSQFSGVPSTLPELSKELYNLIVRFPEPLRATTWLRCCYEPLLTSSQSGVETNGNSDIVPGEVTQISLWKAYEKQFQEIWDTEHQNPEFRPLLPAVDFIKNVTHAFPNSEAMVVNLESGPDEAPKKKFIIKGIQPRQFAVNIDIGNYEALKPSTVSSTNSAGNHKLPIGHMDQGKFDHAINGMIDSILDEGSRISKNSEFMTQINLYASDILTQILNEVFEANDNLVEDSTFRFYNSHWLPDVLYANPSLVESGLIDIRWLKYLV